MTFALVLAAELVTATAWEGACEREAATTHVERFVARERAIAACRSLGATDNVCEALDAVVVRESSGMPQVEHKLGPNEHGRGLAGLAVRLHADKWKAGTPEEALCVPEVSAVIVMRIWRTAIMAYGARDLLDLQRVFAGRFDDLGQEPTHPRDRDWCSRLRKRGVSCLETVRLKSLGRELRRSKQDTWLAGRFASWRKAV